MSISCLECIGADAELTSIIQNYCEKDRLPHFVWHSLKTGIMKTEMCNLDADIRSRMCAKFFSSPQDQLDVNLIHNIRFCMQSTSSIKSKTDDVMGALLNMDVPMEGLMSAVFAYVNSEWNPSSSSVAIQVLLSLLKRECIDDRCKEVLKIVCVNWRIEATQLPTIAIYCDASVEECRRVHVNARKLSRKLGVPNWIQY